MRSVAGRCARRFVSCTDWDSLARFSIRCGCGTVIARRCRCRRNRFVLFGRKTGETMAQTDKAQNDEAKTDNPSRERILGRIRAGLRTSVPEAGVTASDRVGFEPVIFEPVANPLERFQRECVSNLMECALTADCAASARQLFEVLESLPDGESFLQDDPSLRRLLERT